MKSKKEKQHSFWKGFQSTFDLYGLGFERNYRLDHINNSWYNVGMFFTNSFNDCSLIDREKPNREEDIRNKGKQRRKHFAQR